MSLMFVGIIIYFVRERTGSGRGTTRGTCEKEREGEERWRKRRGTVPWLRLWLRRLRS